MKKFLPLILGIVGLGLAGYSLTRDWVGWTQSSQYGQGFTFGRTGAEIWQGLAASASLALGFALLFFKPKLAVIPAVFGLGFSLWVQFFPPEMEAVQWNPQRGLFFAVAAAVLVALAGILKPKHV